MRTLRARAAALAVSGLLIAGCDGQDGHDPEKDTVGPDVSTTSGSTDASADTGSSTSAGTSAADDPFASTSAPPEPSTTATGTVPAVDGEVELGLISVEPAEEQTRVTWALRSADGTELAVSTLNGLENVANAAVTDVRGATLALPDGTRLQPLLTGTDESGTVVVPGCLCSKIPSKITGDWTVLTSTYPALPDGTSKVTLQLPGTEGSAKGPSVDGVPGGS